jgi:dTDP-4-dehydrorhamnose 3,5-epimerase
LETFFESFNQAKFEDAIGRQGTFVQDNHSRSNKNVLRGLYYQIHQSQGKLVRVVQGEALDVAVDIRKSSPPLDNGSVEFYRPITNARCGCPKALPMDL